MQIRSIPRLHSNPTRPTPRLQFTTVKDTPRLHISGSHATTVLDFSSIKCNSNQSTTRLQIISTRRKKIKYNSCHNSTSSHNATPQTIPLELSNSIQSKIQHLTYRLQTTKPQIKSHRHSATHQVISSHLIPRLQTIINSIINTQNVHNNNI